MRNYDCIQPHNDVLASTARGQEQECSEQHSALAVKTIKKWATMAVKTLVSTTRETKQCFYYEGKVMKQG
jgi:hypothetical protein